MNDDTFLGTAAVEGFWLPQELAAAVGVVVAAAVRSARRRGRARCMVVGWMGAWTWWGPVCMGVCVCMGGRVQSVMIEVGTAPGANRPRGPQFSDDRRLSIGRGEQAATAAFHESSGSDGVGLLADTHPRLVLIRTESFAAADAHTPKAPSAYTHV